MDLKQTQPDDHEADMAKADCYKLAKYSDKLYQMIEEGENLDGSVAAQITKASDYISSVYHYLEYEKMNQEKNNQGPRDFDESIERQVRNNLAEQWQNKKQGR